MLRKLFGFLLAQLTLLLNNPSKRLFQIKKEYDIIPLYSHNISKRSFEKLVRWLIKNNLEFISTSELIDVLSTNRQVKNKVWFTLDDGWKQNIKLVPILTKYKIPLTIFISTGCIELGYFWFSIVYKYKKFLSVPHPHDLWHFSEDERQGEVSNLLMNIDISSLNKETLSVDDIRQMSCNQLIEFGNHTSNHVLINNCSETQISRELNEANEKINNWTKRNSESFSYPNGTVDDRSFKYLKANMIKIAAVTLPDYIKISKVNMFAIPRISIPNNYSLAENMCRVLLIWPFMKLKNTN